MELVQEVGKRDNYARRAPRVYSLIATAGYFLGIDTGHDRLNLAITDFCGDIVYSECNITYEYENTEACFQSLTDKVNAFIEESGIARDTTLADALTQSIGVPSCIDNDTRCMLYGEWLKGCCRGYRNVVFVNISWGIGIGIINDGKMYLGKSGYSGEIGHMHIYNNDIICHCGKTGCMETEASGWALQRKMAKAIADGAASILSDRKNPQQTLTLDDILDAIAREDVLSIEKLQEVAVELGINLAGIINVFNPDMLVIGGDLSVTGDYLTLPICMGIKKYSLNVVNEDSIIATSTLTNKAGLIGACLMARHKVLNKNL